MSAICTLTVWIKACSKDYPIPLFALADRCTIRDLVKCLDEASSWNIWALHGGLHAQLCPGILAQEWSRT